MYYLTADTHFMHANIALYCSRPFFSDDEYYINDKGRPEFISKDIKDRVAEEMSECIVDNINKTCCENDTLWLLGDLCFDTVYNGEKRRGDYWVDRLKPKVNLIRGNHDKKTNVKPIYNEITGTFEGQRIHLRHKELTDTSNNKPKYDIDLVLCGHVHNEWKYKYTEYKGKHILNINVGVDQWGLKPVSMSAILKYKGK